MKAMNILVVSLLLIIPTFAFADECMDFAVYICESCPGDSEACQVAATTAVTQERAKRMGRTKDVESAGKTCTTMKTASEGMVTKTNKQTMCVLIENAANQLREQQAKE